MRANQTLLPRKPRGVVERLRPLVSRRLWNRASTRCLPREKPIAGRAVPSPHSKIADDSARYRRGHLELHLIVVASPKNLPRDEIHVGPLQLTEGARASPDTLGEREKEAE